MWSTGDTLSVQIIVFPEGSELVFSTHVPDGEFQVLIFNCLHIETFKKRLKTLFRTTLKRRHAITGKVSKLIIL